MNTIAVVQARLASTRLPGKALADLGGRPLLAHVLERAGKIPGVSRVVLATTVQVEDDALAELVRPPNECVRGSSPDVLSRFVRAAQLTDADRIVRLTGDCPLIDPAVCGQVLELLHGETEYAHNLNPPTTWPEGLDAQTFTAAALFRAHRTTHGVYDREHVCPWMVRNLKGVALGCPEDLHKRRWCVDTPKDLARVRTIVSRLTPGDFSWRATAAAEDGTFT